MNYPYIRQPGKGRDIRIEVAADSMRVGKTTAIQVVAEGLRAEGFKVSESYEDWVHNPYLKQSYDDPAKNFLNSQMWFIKRKWEQIKLGARGKIYLQDVSPEMDFCYAATSYELGRMSKEDFATYAMYYHSLDWSLTPAPTILIYLKVSDDELLRRVESSRREFETVENTYFLTMKKINRDWLAGAKSKYHLLEIDTDMLDFAHDERAKIDLVAKVTHELYNSSI